MRLGGDFAPLTLHGQWWRVGSSMFLHYGILHIGMNMLVLWQGRVVEVVYGSLGFLAIYLAAGLLGSVTSVWHAQWVVSAGASGAVFGVFGAFGAFLLLRRNQLDPQLVRRRGQSLITFIGLNMYIGLTQPNIDISAHVGGLIIGFVVGCVLAYGPRAGKLLRKRAVAVLVLTIPVVAVALVVMPKPIDADGELQAFGEVDTKIIDLYKGAMVQLDAHAITAAQMVELIDTQVLPPWRAARARVERVRGLPPRIQHWFELLDQYAKDREDMFVEAKKFAEPHGDDFVAHFQDLKNKIQADVEAFSEARRNP